ncbi:tetratricopeptide repeat protein [Puniceicoccus vermicola]|uniref:Tetratricopeptide repeat protein n=1 Tax=Puniceicoccus vermicola TaxID=388746 RepID=A0A7X1E331_9BACT|nr:tetratricopeptide repeat protein [Puniceicoccus vermicola]MBC2600544.1 tetratricopeptide repeat protein [Puniceicoccus vermicola]
MVSRLFTRITILVAIPTLFAIGYVVSGQENDPALLIRARELRLNEVYLESARVYRAYLAEYPDDLEARLEFGELLVLLDQPVDAANQVIPILNEEPDNAEAREIFDQSLVKIEEDLDPTNSVGLLQIARLKRFSGNEEESQEYYIRYLQAVPEDSLALHELAQMVYDSGDHERGQALLVEAIRKAPDDETRKELLLKQATWLSYDEETQDEAVIAFQDLLVEYPDMAQAYLNLGDLYRYRGDYEEAGEAYLKAIQYGGASERATEGYFQVLLQTRALQTARKEKIAGNYEEAVTFYELHFQEMELTRQKLAQIQALEAQGVATENQVMAADFFERFLAETPDEVTIRLEAADSYAQIGETEQAMEETERAIELKPDDREIRLQLARYQTYDSDSVVEAGETLDAVAEIFGPDAEVSTLRGDVYRFEGDYVEASAAYRRALEENPNDPVALQGLEEIKNAFSPEFYGGLGFIRDWSSDFDHFFLGLGLRNVFSGIQHRVDLEVDALYYNQPVSTQNPELSNNTNSVAGTDVMVSVSGPIERPWSYLLSLGANFYNKVDWTPVGQLALGYAGDQVNAVFGFRRKEAVDDHYNLSALLDEVRMNDFFGQVIYQTIGDEVWERWQVEGYGETGWFSDDNYRSRGLLTLMNRTYESAEDSLKLGVRGLYTNYRFQSLNYFSPSDYYGIGLTGRLDHHFNEDTDGGVSASAIWIEQVEEFDIAVGGYLYHQISDSARGSLRLDYGQSTFQQGDIRSISGRAEVEILF